MKEREERVIRVYSLIYKINNICGFIKNNNLFHNTIIG